MTDPTTVKSNVATMVDKGATEAEIEAYIASEGTDAQALRGGHMSPADERGYLALAADPRSTAAALQAYAQQRGFAVTDADAQDFIRRRHDAPTAPIGTSIDYRGNLPAAPAPAPVQPATEPNSAWQTWNSAAGHFLDGVLPGLSRLGDGLDGVASNAWNAITGNGTLDPAQGYRDGNDAAAPIIAQFDRDHPDAASAAGWAGFGGSFLLPEAKVVRGASLGAHMANGALHGAACGTAGGLLNDTGEGRLANAENGALFGGVLGAAAAPIAGKLSQSVATARRNIPGVNGALTGLGNLPRRLAGVPLVPASVAAHAQAERLINREMDGATIDAGMGYGTVPATPQTVAAEVVRRGALGIPAMPADVSEPLRSTTAWALRGNGTMATRARVVLSSRQAHAGSRVREHVQAELGPVIDPIAEVENIRRRASAASAPGYAAAYAQPMVVTPEIAGIMRTPAFQDALPQAVRNIRNAQRDPAALGFAVSPNGALSAGHGLSTEGFDQVVRAMTDSGRAAATLNAVTGQVTHNTNSLHIANRANDLRGALSAQNPAYRDAVANYADEAALRQAIRQGEAVGRLSGPEIDAQRRAMPPAAQEGWAAGARTALADTATDASLRPAANVPQAVRQRIGSAGSGGPALLSGDAAKMQAIEDMTGRRGALSRLDDRLEGEDQTYRTFADTAAAPPARGALSSAMGVAGGALSAARKLAHGNIGGALSAVILHGNPRGTATFRRDVAARTAQVLTATAPADVAAHMGALSQRPTIDRARRGVLSRRAGKLARAGILQAAGQDTSPIPLEGGSLSPLEAPYSADEASRAPM